MDSGPWALVTGATRGIGRACVEQLLARGRRVVACARDETRLKELEQAHAGRLIGIAVDLTVAGAPARVVDEALSRVGTLREVVYAAGVVHYAAVGVVEESSLRAQVELNFVAPFMMLQQAGLHMRTHGGGAMVLIASTLAERGAPATAAYAASKAALVSAARSFARELAPSVRVNVIAPGVVDTDMIRVPRRALSSEAERTRAVQAQLEQLRALHPLGRLGTPSDIAEAALYLLDAQWVTGSILTVDGGLTVS